MNAPGRKLYRLDEIVVDTAQRSVCRDGETVRLRARSFELLLYLIDNRDRIVSRQELLEALWAGTVVTDNSIMQCVNEVRRALGDDSRNPRFILTVSKSGYQFIGPVVAAGPEAAAPFESAAPLESAAAPAVLAPESASPVHPAHRRWFFAAAVLFAAMLTTVAGAKLFRHQPEPVTGEVAWWTLDTGRGAAIADSIHSLSATLPTGVSWTPGISRSALQFLGSEIVVAGNDPGVLPRGVEPRTVMAWVKTALSTADSMIVFQHGDPQADSGSDRFSLAVHESGVGSFGSNNVILGKRRVDDGQWHQLAGVFEGGEQGRLRLFIDGLEDAAPMPSRGALNRSDASEWAIGRGMRNGTSFRGAIDDVRVYAQSLRPTQILSVNRCMEPRAGLDIGGRAYYLGPLYGENTVAIARLADEESVSIRHIGNDLAGVTFVERLPGCPLNGLSAADLGQDFRLEMELQVDPPPGAVTEAGPFFRSRRANPGDGIVGGTSAGFWVRLDSTGRVRVMRLHPMATIAFSDVPTSFDASQFHKLEVVARGENLQVSLDGRLLEFDCGGVRTSRPTLAPLWLSATPQGNNDGSAGIAFSCLRNRGTAGGQQVRNIRIEPMGAPQRATR